MTEVPFETNFGSCKIKIELGLFKEIPDFLKKEFPTSRFVIITDETVFELYGNKLGIENSLILKVPNGEDQKNLETTSSLIGEMLEANITRNDVVIGLGGGMITDLAGFVASLYMRGIKYVAIPTTLLCMADAAIGGKTGVDFKLPKGNVKNVVGTTYIPKFVLIDPELVANLPRKQFENGMGEIIKYAAIIDPDMMNDFEKVVDACEPTCHIGHASDLAHIIEKCVHSKISIANTDPLEGGRRKILNFGHTFGHAIESATNFGLNHGEAISIGMVISNHIAQKLGKQKPEVGQELKAMLEKFNLPTALPENIKLEDLEKYIANDKKRSGDKITFIIITEMGKTEMIPLTPKELIDLAR